MSARLFAAMAGALVAAALACGPRAGDPGAGGLRVEVVENAPRPLTAQEEAGRAIFDRENCARCHTLLDRPGEERPARLPAPAAQAAIPSRVGPDLGLEGHRRSEDWQYAHLYAPDALMPGSPMPASRHLFRTAAGGMPEPGAEARDLVTWLQTLGRGQRDIWAEFRTREPEIEAFAPMPAEAQRALGDRLYKQHCVACHGEAGDGQGPAAPLLARSPRSFVTAAYRFRSNGPWDRPRDADLFRAVTLGTGIGAAMPSFYFLSADERWALVSRIKEFSPVLRGSVLAVEPPPSSGSGAAARSGTRAPSGTTHPASPPGSGRALWGALGCARCHGADAAGRTAAQAGLEWIDAEGTPIIATGDLRHACARRGGGSDLAFERAIRFGVGAAMPSFGEALAGEPDAARALRLYVESRGDDTLQAGH